jgi:hypothetical protein
LQQISSQYSEILSQLSASGTQIVSNSFDIRWGQ